jgi:N-acyl-D-amino-acid deacylase
MGQMAMAPSRSDVIVRHGLVIDGTGGPRRMADVAIDGDRIVAIGDLSSMAGDVEIEASGRIVAPGFIDVHTHDDGAVISCPEIPAKTSQGVTTVVVGNCGFSLAPLRPRGALPQEFRYLGEESAYRFPKMGDYVAALETRRAAVNTAILVGHATLRMGSMADVSRPATDREIAVMQARLGEALQSARSDSVPVSITVRTRPPPPTRSSL